VRLLERDLTNGRAVATSLTPLVLAVGERCHGRRTAPPAWPTSGRIAVLGDVAGVLLGLPATGGEVAERALPALAAERSGPGG
jgi:hypothetical protein